MAKMIVMAVALAVAGGALIVLGSSDLVRAFGVFVLGTAGVLAASATFYAVGHGEDEHRARHPRG